ncbi:MAG: hypothetical protein AVDCRST_MAG87-1306 [uncultured Thermomicrobiales bacterium]|uniref:Uncharacterized protein n=1 Tax=uncultured Thermomicrobiales bacterium TaxID=1645740 RepID=A0A6J4UTC5_9BACT|nr:MAG: hypothetical protein AVDCRST_MAG87-1306 [uncultured Thermomicrobiales bacterium]
MNATGPANEPQSWRTTARHEVRGQAPSLEAPSSAFADDGVLDRD